MFDGLVVKHLPFYHILYLLKFVLVGQGFDFSFFVTNKRIHGINNTLQTFQTYTSLLHNISDNDSRNGSQQFEQRLS